MIHTKRTQSRLADTRIAYLIAGLLAVALIISISISEKLERRLDDAVSRGLREQLYECADSLDAYVDSVDPDSRLAAALRFANASSALRLDGATRGALELLSGQLKSPDSSGELSVSAQLLTAPSSERLRSLADIFRLLAARRYERAESQSEAIAAAIASALAEPLAPELAAAHSDSNEPDETDSADIRLDTDLPGTAATSRIARKLSLASAKDSLALLLGTSAAEPDVVDTGASFLARSGNLRAEFAIRDGRLIEYIHIRLGAVGVPLAESELYSRASRYAAELFGFDGEPELAAAYGGFTLYGWDDGSVVLDSAGRLCAAVS